MRWWLLLPTWHMVQGLPQAAPREEQHSDFKVAPLILISHRPSMTVCQQVPLMVSAETGGWWTPNRILSEIQRIHRNYSLISILKQGTMIIFNVCLIAKLPLPSTQPLSIVALSWLLINTEESSSEGGIPMQMVFVWSKVLSGEHSQIKDPGLFLQTPLMHGLDSHSSMSETKVSITTEGWS